MIASRVVRALVGASVVGSAMFATACVTQKSGAVPEQPMWRNRPSYALTVLDRRDVTASTHVVGESYEKGQPALDPAHHRIFVGSSDRHLYALRADDLTTIWSYRTLGFVQCEPLYDAVEDVVYFGSHDGALYKVKASDGTLLWRFNTNAEVNRRPLLYQGLLYAVNANDTVVAIDPKTGALKWSHHRTPALGMEIAGYAGVAGGFGRVYTGFSDGRVVSLDAQTGEERWWLDLAAEAEQASGETPRYLDVDTTPIVTKTATANVVFVAGFAAGMFALDAETGSRLWGNEQATGVTEMTLWEEPAHKPKGGGPTVPAKRLLIGASGNTGLWALRLDDGRDVWRRPLPEGGISAPTPIGGALLVSTTRYGLFLLSPLDGGVIDGIETGSGFAMQPAAYGRRAFVMTNQGSMLSLHLDTPLNAAKFAFCRAIRGSTRGRARWRRGFAVARKARSSGGSRDSARRAGANVGPKRAPRESGAVPSDQPRRGCRAPVDVNDCARRSRWWYGRGCCAHAFGTRTPRTHGA
jgi:outer membrane protein assembly factor BamB